MHAMQQSTFNLLASLYDSSNMMEWTSLLNVAISKIFRIVHLKETSIHQFTRAIQIIVTAIKESDSNS